MEHRNFGRGFLAGLRSVLGDCALFLFCLLPFVLLFVAAADAADHCSGILLIDEAAAAVILVPPLATTQELLWSGDPLVAPTDAILEDDRTLLIADPGAGAIFHFDWMARIEPTLLVRAAVDLRWLEHLTDGEILASGRQGLFRVNRATGDQTLLPTALDDPFDIDRLANGNFLIADPVHSS